MIKKIILTTLLFTFNFILFANGYLFGIKSFDNTTKNITEIQKKYEFDFPIVAFIFDPWSNQVEQTMNGLNDTFGKDKIYHISVSPNNFSAKQVREWYFDENYKKFFELVKKNDLKVIFRTMHEMNGGRYPRSSNTGEFKKARIHVWNLSREVWLDQKNILFDMSINHRDMPTKYKPSQTATLIECNQKNKFTTIENKIFVSTWYKEEIVTKKVALPQSKLDKLLKKPIQYKTVSEKVQIEYPIYKTEVEKEQNCYTFEDYYPGNKYVDILWVTFYNRWKAGYNRHRLYPNQILNDKNRNTLNRLKSFKKPIFIDEVATTAVWYNEPYNQTLSLQSYQNDSDLKNKWLISLKDFMLQNPEILGFVYFNIDYTYWLSQWIIWESDWAIINLNNNKFYTGTYQLYNNQSNNNKLYQLFWTENKPIQTNNISQNSNAQKLATLLIEKFGIEESKKRLNDILKFANNSNLKTLIKETLELLK